MVFNFTAFSYIVALIGDAFLIFFAIFHVIAFDELKTDYKNPIDQCNSLNPVSIMKMHTLDYKLGIMLVLVSLIITFCSWCCPNIFFIFSSIYCSCCVVNGSPYVLTYH